MMLPFQFATCNGVPYTQRSDCCQLLVQFAVASLASWTGHSLTQTRAASVHMPQRASTQPPCANGTPTMTCAICVSYMRKLQPAVPHRGLL